MQYSPELAPKSSRSRWVAKCVVIPYSVLCQERSGGRQQTDFWAAEASPRRRIPKFNTFCYIALYHMSDRFSDARTRGVRQ